MSDEHSTDLDVILEAVRERGARHAVAAYGGYGVTCSCAVVLAWPEGWVCTEEAAKRLIHQHFRNLGVPPVLLYDTDEAVERLGAAILTHWLAGQPDLSDDPLKDAAAELARAIIAALRTPHAARDTFNAHAPDDIAALLARVERLAEVLDILGGMWSWNPDGVPDSLSHLWWGQAGRMLEQMVGRKARDPNARLTEAEHD